MHILSVENLTLSYTEKPLFKNISFNINEGDKIGLIAKNGIGKSSLLKIINNKEEPDNGTVWLNKEAVIIHLEQNPIFEEDKTVLENIFLINNPIFNALKNYEHAQLNNDESGIADAIEQIDSLQIWDIESIIHQILTKLNIDNIDQIVKNLSGGQRKRISLAKVLIECKLEKRHQLLLLDEPTNHLDFDMIEWLEEYLNKEKISIILVTHDRYFLDEVANKIWELQESNIYFYGAGYANYIEGKLTREESIISSISKAKNQYRSELEWMRKQPKARTTKSKSRQDNFYKIESEANKKIIDTNISLQVKMTRLGGKILEMKKVYKSYQNKIILKGFDYSFSKGERIGIIGNNGVGKSTFIKLLQLVEEADSGKINVGETIQFGYYNQEGLKYDKNVRVIEYVKNIAENFQLADGSHLSASQFLELFLFPPEKQFTYLDSLSGGEKKRLLLLTILFKNPNFLILDEPTNDLDIPTLQVLENFLNEFNGCLIIISHDRFFLNKVVDHMLIFKGQGVIHHFYGNYNEYKLSDDLNDNKIKDISNNSIIEKKASIEPIIEEKKVDKKKLSYKENIELNTINKELPLLEIQKSNIVLELQNTNLSYQKINELTEVMNAVIKKIEQYELRWLELNDN